MDAEEQPLGEGDVTRDRADKNLSVTPFKATIKAGGVATVTVPKYKDETRRSRAGDHGKRAWDAVVKYCFESDEIIRDLMDELWSIRMVTAQNPDEYFSAPSSSVQISPRTWNLRATGSTRT